MKPASPSDMTWGLLIVTYMRPQMLRRCVAAALAQSIAPIEIVIIDASPEWEKSREEISSLLAEFSQPVCFIYDKATTRSTTHQRNQGLKQMSADIIFSIDDDSLMHPDCAEKILEIYRKDREGTIAAVGAINTPFLPGSKELQTVKKDEVPNKRFSLRQFLESQLKMEKHFVPYAGWKKRNTSVDGAFSVYLLNGFSLTFRLQYGRQVPWSEVLRYYALHEDADFCYRLSRFGDIVRADEALLCHMQEQGGRLSRKTTDKLRVLNLIALHKTFSDSLRLSAWNIAKSFSQFAVLYLVIDLGRRRFSLPTVRSYLYGLAMMPIIFSRDPSDFPDWYANLQTNILKTNR
jgi:GT2 family glycosyltransferase